MSNLKQLIKEKTGMSNKFIDDLIAPIEAISEGLEFAKKQQKDFNDMCRACLKILDEELKNEK